MNECEKRRFARIPDTGYPGQRNSFLFSGQYLQRVLEEAQPIHLIAPFSLSNISMIILALTITLNHEEVGDAYGVIKPTPRSKSYRSRKELSGPHHMCHKINDAHLLYCDGTRAESHSLCPAFTIILFLLDHLNSLIDVWLYIDLFET
jgi:hypothetical protein